MQSNTISHQLVRGIALVILALVMCPIVAPAGATATPAMRAEPPRTIPTLDPVLVEGSGGAPSAGLADPAELQAFLDDLLARQPAERHIPGASVAVVKDGRLFFAKGYGYANLERHTPLVADQTLIRVGSIAKLFTWTAVLQLVEQGKLDLTADVNAYLAIEKIGALLAPAITVSATADGYLAIAGLSQPPTEWVEVAPLVFRQVNSQETVAFRADHQGQMTHLFQGNLPIVGYRKLAWYEPIALQYGLLAGCVVLFMSTLVVWPIGWLAVRRKGAHEPAPDVVRPIEQKYPNGCTRLYSLVGYFYTPSYTLR
jgi:hypothetical protein